jgi:multiple sugar transport system substrate-binding protein
MRTIKQLGYQIACASLAAVLGTGIEAFAQDVDLGPMPKDGKFDNVTLRISAIAGVYVSGFKKFEQQIKDELGITMQFDVTPPTEAYAKDMLEFRSQTASHDIVLFEPANLADYSRFLIPLDGAAKTLGISFDKQDIDPVYRDVYTSWNGVTYSVPWDGDQHNLFYNVAAFDNPKNKAGFKAKYGYDLAPPQTWSEYRDVAEFMAGTDWNGDGTTKYGVAEAWQQGGYATWWWTDKFGSYGGIWFDNDLKPLINSEAGIKALQNSVDVVKFAPPGSLNFGYPELEAALLKQQVPMVIQWSSTGKAAQDPKVSAIVGNVGVAMVPGVKLADGTIIRRPALPTGWSAGIPKFSKNAAAAAMLLQWISQPEHALALALDPGTAIDPWRASSFANTDAWRKAFPSDPKYGEAFVHVQSETVAKGMPDLQIPGSNEYLTALDRQIDAALAGQKSPKEALDAAAEEWDAISDKLGRDAQTTAWRNQAAAMSSVGIKYEPDWAK